MPSAYGRARKPSSRSALAAVKYMRCFDMRNASTVTKGLSAGATRYGFRHDSDRKHDCTRNFQAR